MLESFIKRKTTWSDGDNVEGSCDGDVVQKGRRKRTKQKKKKKPTASYTLL
jgi:hypothetical protein